jgi:HlyD family secretion protein
MMTAGRRRWMIALVVVAFAAAAYYAWQKFGKDNLPPGIASGNGRIEAVEIDIATKTPGRIQEILVREGDFVTAGQVLARMNTAQLEAQHRQAKAQLRRAIISVDTAKSLVIQRQAEKKSTDAVVAQRNAELDTADRKLQRSTRLIRTNAVPQQVLGDDRAAADGATAAVAAAQAQLAASEAAISSAQAQKRRSTRPGLRSRASRPTSRTVR